MNHNYLEQLQDCCRDQAAVERMKQIWTIACRSSQQNSLQLEQKTKQQQALFRVLFQIRERSALETIFKVTTAEVRQLLNADRVALLRFDAEAGWSQGEFIAEAVLPQFSSTLTTKIDDRCLVQPSAADAVERRIQAIADIHAAGLQEQQIEVLQAFQVRAYVVLPLLQGSFLWGLLCIHQCSAPRQWQPDEIEFVSQIAIQLEVALQQAELIEQAQQKSAALAQALEHLQKAQTQSIQSEKMSSLGKLLIGVAHEINNPIHFICGNLAYVNRYAQDLIHVLALYQQEHSQPSGDLRDRIEAIHLDKLIKDFPKVLSSMRLGADRICKIVESLRSFAQPDAADMQPTNIQKGLEDILLLLQHRLKPRVDCMGIKVIKEYSNLPVVSCYRGQLNQVLMHLLSNAIDALEDRMAEGNEAVQPQITLRTMLIPTDNQGSLPRAVIQVADNGSGISETIQTQLFKPFLTTKPMDRAAGLGLSISYQIARQHGGELQYFSQLGQGTEFWLELPVEQTVCTSEPSYSQPEDAWPLTRTEVQAK